MFEPHEVLFINVEQKALPFNSKNWKNIVHIEQLEKLYEPNTTIAESNPGVLQLLLNPEWKSSKSGISSKDIKIVIIDSLTRTMEKIDNYTRRNGIKGYDKWDKYADVLRNIFNVTAQYTDKYVIYTGLEDREMNMDGITEKVTKVKGKELRGLIESYFTIVLWATYDRDEPSPEKRYRFLTQTDGECKAKTPYKMFTEHSVPNDIKYVIEQIDKFYGFTDGDGQKIPNILITGSSGYGKTFSFRNILTIKTEISNIPNTQEEKNE